MTDMNTPNEELRETASQLHIDSEMCWEQDSGFTCTREHDHEGVHVAHGVGYCVIHKWMPTKEINDVRR